MNGADVVGHPATPAEAQLAVTGFESLDAWAYRCKVGCLETNRSAEEPSAKGVAFETIPDFEGRARHKMQRCDSGSQFNRNSCASAKIHLNFEYDRCSGLARVGYAPAGRVAPGGTPGRIEAARSNRASEARLWSTLCLWSRWGYPEGCDACS